MLDILYCSVCSNELVSAGHEIYSQEEYYVCPSCNSEHTVIINEDNIMTIQTNIDTSYVL